MNEEEAAVAKESALNTLEDVVESGHYTKADILDDVEDRIPED